MDVNRLGTGEKIAGASAIALILIMFIFKWFGLEAGLEVTRNAWGAYGFTDIVLFITVLAALALAVTAANSTQVNLPVALSAIVTGLGLLSLVLIIISIISPPNFSGVDLPDAVDKTRKIGVWLGLIATAALTYGGWTAMQQEGTSFAAERDRLGGRGGGTPRPPAGGGTGTPPPPAGGTGTPPPSTGTTPPPSSGGPAA